MDDLIVGTLKANTANWKGTSQIQIYDLQGRWKEKEDNENPQKNGFFFSENQSDICA